MPGQREEQQISAVGKRPWRGRGRPVHATTGTSAIVSVPTCAAITARSSIASPASVMSVCTWERLGEYVRADLAELRVIGQHHQARTDADERSIRLRLSDIRGRRARLRVETVHAEVGRVDPEGRYRRIGDRPDERIRRRADASRQIDRWRIGAVRGGVGQHAEDAYTSW